MGQNSTTDSAREVTAMNERTTQLRLVVNSDPEADDQDLAALAGRLRTEILDLDVADVELLRAGEIPGGAKTGDVVTWGALLVTLAASEGVLTTLIGFLRSWLTRNEQRSVSLEIDGDRLEVTGISSAEQQRLIDEWLKRHKLVLGPHD
jgi:hypothetical protein